MENVSTSFQQTNRILTVGLIKLGWGGPFLLTGPDSRGKQENWVIIPAQSVQVSGEPPKREGRLWTKDISSSLPYTGQRSNQSYCSWGFLRLVKRELVCTSFLTCIDTFFLSTNSYWAPTKCRALCCPKDMSVTNINTNSALKRLLPKLW